MLYFVSTPIGNMKDITLRAVEVLESVDVIACEDTRHSQILLNNYRIKKPLLSCHKFNEREAGEKIIGLLKDGKNVAVISDAGTPIISDPGNVLVRMLVSEGEEFTVVPGANAFVPALILSAMDASRFTFVGFLPEKKKDAEKLLEKYSGLESTLIFYCAPHDVDDVVKKLYESLGNRKAVAVREITKLYEERCEFYLAEGYKGEKRGEFVIVVEGAEPVADNVDPLKMVDDYIASGYTKMDAIKQTAKDLGIKKNELYQTVLASRGEGD